MSLTTTKGNPRLGSTTSSHVKAPCLIPGGVGGGFPALGSLKIHDMPVPQVGTIGRKIILIANHFKVDLPQGNLYHYDVDIRPSKASKTDPSEGLISSGHKPEGIPKRINPKLCRRIFEVMTKKYMFDSKRSYWPAYDGNRNMYTREQLPIETSVTFCINILTDPPNNESLEKFEVTIKPALSDETGGCEVSLEPLHQLLEGRSSNIPEEAVTALDIILRHGPSLKFVPVGRSFFMKPRSSDEIPLGEGAAIWFGYHQSLRPGWKALPGCYAADFHLNINKVGTAFLKPVNLIEFNLEVLRLKAPPPKLSLRDIQELNKKVKGIQIKVTHMPYPRKYRVNSVLSKNSDNTTFEYEGKRVTVREYFTQKYNLRLRYPNYPCVHVGNPSKDVYLPMEVCEVVDEQPSRGKLTPLQSMAMIKHTAVPPERRFREIQDHLRQTIENNREVLRDFNIKISTDPVTFDARVMQAPVVNYKSSTSSVSDGRWTLKGNALVASEPIAKWILLDTCALKAPVRSNFVTKLISSGRSLGMAFSQPLRAECNEMRIGGVGSTFQTVKNVHPGLQLVLIIIPKSSGALYREIKFESEVVAGLLTQCVTDENVSKCTQDRFHVQYLSNVCLKINAKLRGVNNSLQKEDKPAIFRAPVIIIGADMSIPASGVGDQYSIAACVGSMDAFPARYACQVRAQTPSSKLESKETRILDLASMVKNLLLEFYRRTGQQPRRIVFFRNGVSEGQFLQVRDYEMRQIRQACSSLDEKYKPGVTYVVVQKGHHTRFIPRHRQDAMRNGNVPPGTVVDTTVVHPNYFNFFLCSHAGLLGTSRPAHYTVLWDENDFTADTLQKFVYYLCHTYNRCTTSVSAPPPVMYASLAAYRAKLHLEAKLESLSGGSASSEDFHLDVSKFLNTTAEISNTMYFV